MHTSFNIVSVCPGDGERFCWCSSFIADGDVYDIVFEWFDGNGGVLEARGDKRKSVGDGIGVFEIDGDNNGLDCESGILCSRLLCFSLLR